jgi:hypothetical protein
MPGMATAPILIPSPGFEAQRDRAKFINLRQCTTDHQHDQKKATSAIRFGSQLMFNPRDAQQRIL